MQTEASANQATGPAHMLDAYPYGLKTLTPHNTIVEALKLLGPGFRLEPMTKPSPYIKTWAAMYDFNGKEWQWDVVESHPSVGVVLYHKDLDAFLIVRQFRPAVYSSLLLEAKTAGKPQPPLAAAFTYELCAGLIDKSKSNVEICQEEILEECGFSVPLEAIREVGVGIASAGTQGCKHIMYYGEVDASMAVPGGGGGLHDHGECLEVLALPFTRSQEFVLDSNVPKSAGLMFGLTWAYFNKLNGALGPRPAAPAAGNSASLMNDELVLRPVLPA